MCDLVDVWNLLTLAIQFLSLWWFCIISHITLSVCCRTSSKYFNPTVIKRKRLNHPTAVFLVQKWVAWNISNATQNMVSASFGLAAPQISPYLIRNASAKVINAIFNVHLAKSTYSEVYGRMPKIIQTQIPFFLLIFLQQILADLLRFIRQFILIVGANLALSLVGESLRLP